MIALPPLLSQSIAPVGLCLRSARKADTFVCSLSLYSRFLANKCSIASRIDCFAECVPRFDSQKLLAFSETLTFFRPLHSVLRVQSSVRCCGTRLRSASNSTKRVRTRPSQSLPLGPLFHPSIASRNALECTADGFWDAACVIFRNADAMKRALAAHKAEVAENGGADEEEVVVPKKKSAAADAMDVDEVPASEAKKEKKKVSPPGNPIPC